MSNRITKVMYMQNGKVYERYTRFKEPLEVEIPHTYTYLREQLLVLEESAALRDTHQLRKEQRPRVKVLNSSTVHNDGAYRSSSTEVVIEAGNRNDHRRRGRYQQEEPRESEYDNHDREHYRHERVEDRERRRAGEVEAEINIRETRYRTQEKRPTWTEDGSKARLKEIDIRDTRYRTQKKLGSTLSESMRQVESVLGQLIRFGFEIRQFSPIERSRIVDATPNVKEQANIRQELIGKLLASNGKTSVSTHKAVLLPNDQNADGLSRVQNLLIDSILKCQINIDHAWIRTGNLRSQVLPVTQAGDALRSTSLFTRHGEDRSGIIGSFEQSLQGPQQEQRMDMISEVLTKWFDEHWESPYPTPAEKATLQKATGLDAPHLDTWLETRRSKNLGSNSKGKNIAWSRRELVRRDGSDSVPGQSSTQASFEPGIVQASTASGYMNYSEPLKVAQYGKPGSQCPFCVQTFAPALGEDSCRWRLVSSFYESITSSDREHRKHLDQHLLPYICPIEDCSVADPRYSSAEEWKSHLYKNHTWYTYWQCPACSEKPETSRDFVVHIRQNHNHIIDLEFLDDFAEQCKQSELIPLTCPVCGDQKGCALDDIAQHIHTFSVSSLSWPDITSPPDRLVSSKKDDSPNQNIEDLVDEEALATPITGEGHQVNPPASLVGEINRSTVTLDDVRQSFNTTTSPVSASPKHRNQAFDPIQSSRFPPLHRPPTSTKDLGSVWEATKHLRDYRVPPKPTVLDLGPYTSPQPKLVHRQEPIVTSVPDRTLETSSIIELMSPVDPTENYEQAVKLGYPDTDPWFLDSDSFSRYKAGAIHNICLYGESRFGKLVLCSTIITHLAMKPDSVTVYFFFGNRDTQKQTGDTMLRSLTSQLFRQREECQRPLSVLYGAGKGNRPTGQALERTLVWMIMLSAVQVYIILDALDECREQDVVLEHMREMLRWNYTKTRVILTSRNAVQPVEGELFPIRKQNMDEDIKRNILSW
jgi:hypothetical protein